MSPANFLCPANPLVDTNLGAHLLRADSQTPGFEGQRRRTLTIGKRTSTNCGIACPMSAIDVSTGAGRGSETGHGRRHLSLRLDGCLGRAGPLPDAAGNPQTQYMRPCCTCDLAGSRSKGPCTADPQVSPQLALTRIDVVVRARASWAGKTRSLAFADHSCGQHAKRRACIRWYCQR